MIGTIESVYLGVVEKSGKNGSYHIVTFIDGGEAVSVMLSRDVDVRTLPKVMTECLVTVEVKLGRYPDKRVLGVEYGRSE